ncbi:MAG: carbamoyl-phosphate synthase large subunit, partial [Bacteriovoracaceae bacterium]|nr:carbamoyl-phosphate synthase large subunit [Bacteriovoracaceae bacterium]
MTSFTSEAEKNFITQLKSYDCYLHFEFGKTYKAKCNVDLENNEIWGESAFTTGMSGYEETITDPSFLGQHIIFSAAHIGNYETKENVIQSDKIHCTAIIARNISYSPILASLKNKNIPLISDLDTRSIVRAMVRNPGKHLTCLSHSPQPPKSFRKDLLITDDLHRVSTAKKITHIQGANPIVLIDYGVKNAIIEAIKTFNLPFVQVPHKTSYEEILNMNPRLVFLSNGPGDPRKYTEEIETVQKILMTDIPVRAICLGHQLISLALGLKVEKLPFGQRGINHPIFDRLTNKVVITSQNHGYAIETEDFQRKAETLQLFAHQYSLFDHSIEGMMSKDQKIISVQYHPENYPGPKDGDVFFDEIKSFLNNGKQIIHFEKISPYKALSKREHKNTPYKKILLIGSGPIKIGQASEFDYSGTQALKALKEEGIDVVLLNSNPATIMTDPEMCTRTYVEPITKDTIKKIIEKENVDAVLSTMGGQTALNICVELEEEGYFKTKLVTLLGANVDTIKKTEDRALFAKELETLNYQTGKRYTAESLEEAVQLAKMKVGFPLIIRRDFALGGKGAALVYSPKELETVLSSDPKFPVTMEKSLVGQKEIELEVMVDEDRNGVIICSIENVDPCGVHTGDSITVAPAMTISDHCLQRLRTMSLTIAKHMGVVAGGANVQFAINPLDESDITVIEMNPRVSRSSALASKATGYPIAKISALLAIGYRLHEIINDITETTPVSFEPTLDYVAVKIPLFPFHKFPASSKNLGPQMRSVGEVLSLGGSFNEAFLKALRSLEMGLEIP